MSDEINTNSQDKHGQCKPTKRRDKPTKLSDINGLQVATELQGFRYLTIPSSESSRSISMSVIHNGNAIITRSFRPGQNRQFDDALLDCDTEARAMETADKEFPAPYANANPRDILNAHTSGPLSVSSVAQYQSVQHEDVNFPQFNTPSASIGLSATRTMFMDPYFDVMAPSLNPRELTFGQYSNVMQQQLTNPSARSTISDSLDPNNGLTEGQNLAMNTQSSQVPRTSIGPQARHLYEPAEWINQGMGQYSPNVAQTDRQVVSCPHSNIPSHQIGQQRQQISPHLQAGTGLFAYHAPSNVSDHRSRVDSSSSGHSTEIGTHGAYPQASGSSSTAAPSRMQVYYSPTDVPMQSYYQSLDSSTYGIGLATHSLYDSSPSSYSSNSTGRSQMEVYDPSFYQASYSNPLNLNNNLYSMSPASLGSTPFSTARTSLSPNNEFEHTEPTMHTLSTPSPLFGLNDMPNFGGPLAPLLSFPTIISPDETASGINFRDFDPSNSYLPDTQWHQ